MSLDSFKCRKTLKVGSKSYTYFSLKAAEKNGLSGIGENEIALDENVGRIMGVHTETAVKTC